MTWLTWRQRLYLNILHGHKNIQNAIAINIMYTYDQYFECLNGHFALFIKIKPRWIRPLRIKDESRAEK